MSEKQKKREQRAGTPTPFGDMLSMTGRPGPRPHLFKLSTAPSSSRLETKPRTQGSLRNTSTSDTTSRTSGMRFAWTNETGGAAENTILKECRMF